MIYLISNQTVLSRN